MGESQRLWWVIGSVALLVVVVLAGGLYWLRPQPTATGAGVTASGAFDPYEFVRGGNTSPGLLPAEEVGAGSSEPSVPGSLGLGIGATATGDQDGMKPDRLSAGAEGAVAIRRPARVASDPTPPVRTAAATAAPAAAAPAVARGSAGMTPAVSRSGTTEMLRSAASTPTMRTVEYWIQVASFTSRGRANTVDRQLHDLGVASRITTRSVGDSLFYRVRVGPYLNEREAEKFLGWIKLVDGLTGSYISRVY